MSGRMRERLGWIAVAVCTAAILLWPVVGDIRIANDDIKFVRGPGAELPLADALSDAWRSQPIFRPLEILMAHSSDPVTLACEAVVPVQAAGLVALMAAIAALSRQALPGVPAVRPLAAMLVLLSPATTASVWQMDSCSQTWSAALGAWSTWLAWRWLEGCSVARPSWWLLVALLAVFPIGLTIKETFYGWALGLWTASAVSILSLWRHDRMAARRALWVMVPLTVIPAAHLVLRWQWSALPGVLGGAADGSRYQAEFGTNLLVNSAASIAGAVGMGPFHLLLDQNASVALRLLPVMATGAVIGVILVGMFVAALDSERARAVAWPALIFAASASILSLSATIPMPAVSELYGLGANVGSALLLAAGTAVVWGGSARKARAVARPVVAIALATTVAIGGIGLVSRAVHFAVVWTTVRSLNDAIVGFQAALPAVPAGSQQAAGMVHVPTSCLVGATHSQYVMPPLQVLDLVLTEEWLNRRDPSRRIAFSIGTSLSSPRPDELVLDCNSLPRHGHW